MYILHVTCMWRVHMATYFGDNLKITSYVKVHQFILILRSTYMNYNTTCTNLHLLIVANLLPPPTPKKVSVLVITAEC